MSDGNVQGLVNLGALAPEFTKRLAVEGDLSVLHALMDRAIAQLQHGFLTPDQVRASQNVMGLDSQLVRDRTYFVIEECGKVVGCGGWSFRATLYGGDQSMVAREPARLDPATDTAKIRAMYTDPAHVRRGVGRLLLSSCEQAARLAGFERVELMATMAGVPLYLAAGYRSVREVMSAANDGVTVPLLLMAKTL